MVLFDGGQQYPGEKALFKRTGAHARGMAPVDEAAKRRQVDSGRKKQTQTDGAVRIERQPVFVYLGDSGVHAVATIFSLVFR